MRLAGKTMVCPLFSNPSLAFFAVVDGENWQRCLQGNRGLSPIYFCL